MGKIIAIAALGINREIGQNGSLPWLLREGETYRDDMINFVRMTKGADKIGHPCLMTSATWESLGEEHRPLPGRPNIVVTRRSNLDFPLPKEVARAKTPTEAIHIAGHMVGSNEIYICGGTFLYEWAIDYADELFITEIPEEFPDADAFFPEFLSKGWKEVERIKSPNGQCYFVRYRRQ